MLGTTRAANTFPFCSTEEWDHGPLQAWKGPLESVRLWGLSKAVTVLPSCPHAKLKVLCTSCLHSENELFFFKVLFKKPSVQY